MTVCGAVSPNSQEEVEPCLAPKTQKPRYCGCSAFTSNGKDLRTNQLDLHLDPNRHFASPQGPPIMPADSMALASLNPSLPVCRERVVSVQRQEEHSACVFANQTKLLLHRFLAKSVAIGDEITFPIPVPDAVGPEIVVTKNAASGLNRSIYQVPIGYVSQPKQDKRNQHFVSAEVHRGSLGISA